MVDTRMEPLSWPRMKSETANVDLLPEMARVVVASAVSGEGRRKILGFDLFTAEDGAAWTAFLRGLVARGQQNRESTGIFRVASKVMNLRNAFVQAPKIWEDSMVAFRFRSLTRILAPMLLVLAIVLLASCSKEDATTTTVSVGTVTSATTSDQTTAAGGTSTSGQDSSVPPTPPSVPPSGEYAERLPDLEKAVKASPNDLEALGQLAIGYFQTQAFPQAEETYKKMLGIKDAAETHNNLGNVYRDWQKTEQAIEQYEKAIDLDPALGSPYANLAALYMMNGDIERATEAAKAGVEKTSGAEKQQLQALLDSLK